MTKEAMEVSEPTPEENREKSYMHIPTNYVRVPVKHANLGIRSPAMDMSTMVELTSFSTLGKIQPFLVTISSTAALLVDLHCHLSDKEVCGYLGGHWDINTHNLSILGAFPCRYAGKDRSAAAAVESEIAKTMEWKRMTLVGWYHSHPRSHASPSLRDVDAQLDYQIKMKGTSDNGYTPCVGLICSPYNIDGNCYESNFNIFWSMPPPDNRPHEYPRPMLLSFTLSQDHFISQDAFDEIKKCIEYYKIEGKIDFTATLTGNTTYLERLKNSLASKLPGRNRSNCSYWDLIREMICPGSEDPVSTDNPFMSMNFPLVSESLLQHTGNVFLAPGMPPVSMSSLSKQYTNQLKDVVADVNSKQQSLLMGDPLSSYRKSDYDYPTTDYSKASSLIDHKLRPSEYPMPDHLSQHMAKFPDLSKLASFSSTDIAKLSAFSLGDFTKAAETSSAYVRNIANLFGPLGGKSSEPPEHERRPEYSSLEMLQNQFRAPTTSSVSPAPAPVQEHFKSTSQPEDFSEKKKVEEQQQNVQGSSEEKKMNSGVLDMTAGQTKKHQPYLNDGEETLNLSKDKH